PIELRLLAQVPDGEAGRQARLAREAVVEAGHDPEQARLPGPIRPDDPDLGARVERDRDVLQDRSIRRVVAGEPVGAVDELGGHVARKPTGGAVPARSLLVRATGDAPARIPRGSPTLAGPMSVRAAYNRWPQYNRRFTERVAELTDEQLAFRPSAEHWPIWAIVGHTAGSRVYWLCHVFGEPGAETTPFTDPTGEGWEDDLEHPRSSAELVGALTSTFAIIEGALD